MNNTVIRSECVLYEMAFDFNTSQDLYDFLVEADIDSICPPRKGRILKLIVTKVDAAKVDKWLQRPLMSQREG